MRSETCNTCGEEVRFGTRNGVRKWHHRDPIIDHFILFGTRAPSLEESRRLREEWLAANSDKPEEDEKPEIPTHVEVPAVRIEDDDERMPSAALKVIRKARKAGWEAVATYSRGPWMHSTQWTPTGTADLVLLRLWRGPYHVRACWRSMKDPREWKFEYGWIWPHGPQSLNRVTSTEMHAFITNPEEA